MFSDRLEEALRQKEVFKDVEHREVFEPHRPGGVPNLDLSPLKGRVAGEEEKEEGSVKGGRVKNRLKKAMERGKFEESLDDDDLKFFS
ncbi:hypothetical protein TrCOL_g6154 [Triparma columacea]|uniref:Uncharacterized protein n=1 Tax=Triparma columacea TaxID=722753 RepID=A0A9W7L642_9STRA|nr:hypothetical protein TrCOL_g6154 [Triparma columacea]